MSDESLIPYDGGGAFPETREEALTRQFYEWEETGRGWRLYEHPVELEPPFVPLVFLESFQQPVIDDGRRETFLSSLFSSFRPPSSGSSALAASHRREMAEYQAWLAEARKPVFCSYYNEEFTELQIALPRDFKASRAVAENLLLSFSSVSSPASFEIVGNSETIVYQIAATEADCFQIRQQLEAHLPQSVVFETSGHLEGHWIGGGRHALTVDFGLSNEFFLPLNTTGGAEADLLVTVTGALADLRSDETGVLQVLFQRTRKPWAEEISSALRQANGTPFFANAPEMIPAAKHKVSRPLFAVVVRVAARSGDEDRCWQIAKNIGAGFQALAGSFGNELIPLSNDGYPFTLREQCLLNRQSCRGGMILNCEELAAIAHPPSAQVQSEKLLRESEKTKPAPAFALNGSLTLGENHHRGETRRVTLSSDQRTRHVHLIGSSGSGKSSLLLNMIAQDLAAGEGLCVLDPHGDLVDGVLAHVPEARIKDVVLFDPADEEYPVGFNILEAHSGLEKNLLASDLLATFRRMSTSWGDVMDSVLANAILAFVESERGGTLFELRRFLTENDFRAAHLQSVADDSVRYFWEREFPQIHGKPQSSILIRLDAFLRQRLIRHIVCQKRTRLDFRRLMDERKILLVKLSQGLIGEENAYLLGTLLVSKLYQTALSRQDTQTRPFFWLYLDEFHHFVTPSMESILSGVRKYHLGLVLAHQEFRQLQSRNQEVASSVLSNCYTRICFRLGDADAEKFAGGFSFFDARALQNLGVGEAIARIERAEYDFNLRTPPVAKVSQETAEERRRQIVRLARENYARPRAEVDAELQIPRLSQTESAPETTDPPAKPKEKSAAPPQKPLSSPAEAKAKKPAPTSPPVSPSPGADNSSASSLPFKEPADDGNLPSHRYLQSLVKRVAEAAGFVATIEKEVFGGAGKIDVALERDEQKIACEISVTNSPDYEVKNIQKCRAAGYATVVMIAQDARHLQKIRQKAAEVLSSEEIAGAEFLSPEEFHVWLENLSAEAADTKERVKGFKVNVKHKPVDEQSRETRKKAISDVVLGGLKNLKKKFKGE